MATPEGRRRLEVYEDKVDHAIADRGPEYDWQPGGARVERASSSGPQPATDQEQPRREDVTHHEIEAANQGPARREPMREIRVGVWGPMGGPTDELPSETPGSGIDGTPDENDAREEGHEESGDIGMDVDFLDDMQDPVSTAIMERLGYVASEAMPIKHIVSEVYSPPRITQELKSRRRRFPNLAPGLALDLTVRDPDDGQYWDFSLK